MFELKKELIIEKHTKDLIPFEEHLDNIEIKIIKYESNYLEFDLLNVDCSIANTIRRILMSEIPTMAISKVIVNKYNGVMPEEILAHRLGLLPVLADPMQFQFKSDEATEFTTLVFKLAVRNDNDQNLTVYSDDIIWSPVGSQEERLSSISIKKGIPITKLCKGQNMDLEIHCEKNIGKEHAKWSNACTVSYRLMPVIEIGEIYNEEAHKLKECFSQGVIEIENVNGIEKAVVKNARNDTMSREALRHKEFEDKVFIGKKNDYFIFTLETSSMDPLVMLSQAFQIFGARSKVLREDIEAV